MPKPPKKPPFDINGPQMPPPEPSVSEKLNYFRGQLDEINQRVRATQFMLFAMAGHMGIDIDATMATFMETEGGGMRTAGKLHTTGLQSVDVLDLTKFRKKT